MANTAMEIVRSLAAIKNAAAAAQGGRYAVRDIERHLNLICALTNNAEVRQEGSHLLSHVLGRYANGRRDIVATPAPLQTAVARLDSALRRTGFLPKTDSEDLMQ